MADYVAFINSRGDMDRLSRYYDKPAAGRVQLSRVVSLREHGVDELCPLWIDPELDGYHQLLKGGKAWPDWQKYVADFEGSELMADPAFLRKPNPQRTAAFVQSVLDRCLEQKPKWITVPQLPVVDGSARNKANVTLAEATASWKAKRRFAGRLVYPLIFTHQSQLKGKTQWGPKLQVAKKCFDAATADVVWATDADLLDWKGRTAFLARFESLVAFHSDLREHFGKTQVVAGPYWGMNLVLWARGLCDYPAVSLGHGFAYRVSGGYIPKETPNTVVALTPLRRLAVYSDLLDKWLDLAVGELNLSDESTKQFQRLKNRFQVSRDYERAWNQVAAFYGDWMRRLSNIPSKARSLALFQDLSSAYILGKQLGETAGKLPKSEAPAQDPGKIAEQLMLHCL